MKQIILEVACKGNRKINQRKLANNNIYGKERTFWGSV